MKRYNTFSGYFKNKYGERLQKLVIDAGFSCPNRDGKVSTGGCTFCDNAAFHPNYSTPDKNILEQLDEGITFHKVRYRKTKYYLAYFQAYSNTYAPLKVLKERYELALSHPDVVGIVIGTRPDCVNEAKLDYLADLSKSDLASFKNVDLQEGTMQEGTMQEGKNEKEFTNENAEEEGKNQEKFQNPVIVVEYGIESCLNKTLKRINRGHDFECARKAVEMTAERGLQVGAHFILGLPGESKEEMLSQCEIINSLPLTSVKFHQLQMIRGTAMEREFEKQPEDFVRLDLDDYIDFVIDILERLRPDLYIERVAGEVPPRFVKEVQWG